MTDRASLLITCEACGPDGETGHEKINQYPIFGGILGDSSLS